MLAPNETTAACSSSYLLESTQNNNNPSLLVSDFSLNNETLTKAHRNKLMMDLLKTSCPGYFSIPRMTRKRILRFLCDNGWIDI
jgi:hypothetical protein